MTQVELHGTCEPRFGAVRDAFAANWTDHDEVGASLCVIVGGETVVDLWGGHADAERSQAWERDTIANVYSSTKGVAAAAAAMLVDRGRLDVERPVVDYWPEFAQSGKSEIKVRHLLTHEAGLAGVDEDLPDGAALDWKLMVGALERQAPLWTPGEGMGYHAITYGWLVGEVIRRVDGRTCGEFVRDEIAGPLGVDFYIGLPESEDGRTAELIAAPGAPPIGVSAVDNLAAKALGLAAPRLAGTVNSREWRAAEFPAANGHGNGRSLAAMYSALAQGGGGLLSGEAVETCGPTEYAAREDMVLGFLVRRSLGFILSTAGGRYEWGPNPRTFGHSGAGGSLGFADPDAGIGFGYVMNQMSAGLGADPRWKPMIDAVYSSL
ncbi:MAG: serine hydrolase [Chloroflexota bacterium]|nr:serine hydrolase [Chloroflexota bacterium]MDE2895642.1 serine hydrolase [Chloroflexota bacterium]